jgi:hypothetical protein
VLDIETLPQPVELVGACSRPDCVKFAANLRSKIKDPRYQRGVSVMAIPDDVEAWRSHHRTARKRAARAQRLGYWFKEVDYSEHSDDMYEINISRPQRQGRPMSAGYMEYTRRGKLPEYPCVTHRTITYGVLEADTLVAYMTLHRSGGLALVSMILGHGDHLQNDIMYLLFAGVVADQAGHGGIFYYNRHDSGQDGLRFFKERLGFSEGNVEWIL